MYYLAVDKIDYTKMDNYSLYLIGLFSIIIRMNNKITPGLHCKYAHPHYDYSANLNLSEIEMNFSYH